MRFLPIGEAKEQLDLLSRSGARTVKLVDRTFNCNAKRAYELFDLVINMDTGATFHFEVAPDLFDGQTISLLAKAPPGRIQLEAGIQSFFEPALKASTRKTNLERVEKNLRAIAGVGNIHLHIDLIAGLPYETLPDFIRGFNRAYSLGAHTLQLGFLKLLHGSALKKQAYPINFAQNPPYEIIGSEWLSANDLSILKSAENALQHTYNKGRFLYSLEYALSESGMLPFSLYLTIGEYAPNHGTALEKYARQLYDFLSRLPGIQPDTLRERMIRDWMGMVKGTNMPPFLKIQDKRLEKASKAAQKILGRKISRDEVALLPLGQGVFVDCTIRDQVTGLYKLNLIEETL